MRPQHRASELGRLSAPAPRSSSSISPCPPRPSVKRAGQRSDPANAIAACLPHAYPTVLSVDPKSSGCHNPNRSITSHTQFFTPVGNRAREVRARHQAAGSRQAGGDRQASQQKPVAFEFGDKAHS